VLLAANGYSAGLTQPTAPAVVAQGQSSFQQFQTDYLNQQGENTPVDANVWMPSPSYKCFSPDVLAQIQATPNGLYTWFQNHESELQMVINVYLKPAEWVWTGDAYGADGYDGPYQADEIDKTATGKVDKWYFKNAQPPAPR